MPQAGRFVSTVDHVVEHPEVWTERLSRSKWGDRIPHMESSAGAGDSWVVDGRSMSLSDVAQVGALMTDRTMVPKRWENVPREAYVATERLATMDIDTVAFSVLYPSLAGFSGETFATLKNLDLELACVQAYNDWLIDEWASCSDRFIPQCIVPLGSVAVAVAEINRAVRRGHKGVVFPAVPMHVRDVPHINSPAYDPIWATCQDLEVPLCFHAGSSRYLQFPVAPTLPSELAGALQAVTRPASAVFDFVNLLFSRILLRFPKLNVIFAESTIGWGTFVLEYADHQYEQDHCDYELRPAEMFSRQCYLTGWYDPVRINARHIGTDRILWSTNFPRANSTWPDSKASIEKCMAGMSEAEQDKMLWQNAAELYKLGKRWRAEVMDNRKNFRGRVLE